MVTREHFNALERNYGGCSSWAIWNPANPRDTQIISENLTSLKTSVIIVGLNISAPLRQPWSNFHFGPNDYKLNLAYNDSSYRGAYMTDLIKGEVEANSKILWQRIKEGIDVPKHVEAFCEEMDDLGVRRNALFILLGGSVSELFEGHLKGTYPNFVKCLNHAAWGTKAAWLDKTWTALERHSMQTASRFGTLPFARNP